MNLKWNFGVNFFARFTHSKWQKWIFDLICALRVDENVWEFLLWLPFKLLGCFVLHTPLAVIMWIFTLCESSKWQCLAVFASGYFCYGYALQPIGSPFLQKAQYDKVPAIIMLQKRLLPVIASEQSERGNPRIYANLTLWIATNLHAHALQIFAMTKIPCHTLLFLVILSAAKYPFVKPWKLKRYAKARCKSLKQSAKNHTFSKLLNSLCFLLKIEPFAKH